MTKLIYLITGLLIILLGQMPVAAASDRYVARLNDHRKLIVQIRSMGRQKAVATLKVSGKSGTWRQQLQFPGGCRPTLGREQACYPKIVFPGVVLWMPTGGGPDLVFYSSHNDRGPLEYKFPIIFAIGSRRAQCITSNPSDTSGFTRRGGFCLDKQHLYNWDISIDDRDALMGQFKYIHRTFVISNGTLRCVRTKLTSKRYWGYMIDEVKPGALFPASDPLKELGFKWRWWGRPSYAAWPHGSKGMTRQLLII